VRKRVTYNGKTLRSLASAFQRDVSGHFAIWTAILALPIIGMTTFVGDYNAAKRVEVELKSALDAATLATVSNQKLNDQEKAAYATEFFNKNFPQAKGFDSDKITLSAKGSQPTSVSAAFGINEIAVQASSTGIVTRENIICVLTLNPSGAESFSLFQGAKFNSPNCAVQVNSSSPEAAYVDRTSSALAKDFCVTGGAVGNFQPFVNTECAPVADPYAFKTAPALGTCKDLKAFKGKGANSPAVFRDNAILTPGTYCEDLQVNGQNITFMPGNYILDDVEIWFRLASSARADGVTFVVRGESGRVLVEQGSNLYIKAPDSGDLAGMAIFQDTASVQGLKHYPTNATELTGGSEMTIVGTVYLPTQTIDIWGNSLYSNTSPATSYIGYDVAMGKSSELTVNVDHEKAGLPPILPRSDEGARLID